MDIRNAVYLFILIFVNITASYAAFVAAPPEETMGDLYRIFYIHTPAAWVCYLSLGIALLSSILFLAKRNFIYDTLAEVSAILGLVYGAIALITGSLWQTLHPQIITGTGISITLPMLETLFLNLIAASLIYLLMLKTMYRLWRAQEHIHFLTYERGN